jgi:hypothetical protein
VSRLCCRRIFGGPGWRWDPRQMRGVELINGVNRVRQWALRVQCKSSAETLPIT